MALIVWGFFFQRDGGATIYAHNALTNRHLHPLIYSILAP